MQYKFKSVKFIPSIEKAVVYSHKYSAKFVFLMQIFAAFTNQEPETSSMNLSLSL